MKDKLTFVYSKLHFLNIALTLSKDFSSACGGSRAAKIASSNTIFSPVCLRKKIKLFWNIKKLKKKRTCVSAEHSTYLTALNSLASFSPASLESGFCLFFANLSMVATSSRKSICVPTSRNGVFWQWCEISGTHWKTRLKVLNFCLTKLIRNKLKNLTKKWRI